MKISFSNNKNSDATVKNNIKIPYGNAKRIFPQLKWWFEPYCLLRTPRMAGTIKPGGVDNERKTI